MTLRRAGYACWLLAAAVLYFFENNTGTRAVLLSSALIPAFSVCCAAWTAKKASCRLSVPESVEKGKTAACGAALSGPWTKIGCVLSCRMRSTHWMTHETSEWNVNGEGAFSVNCAHCGTLLLAADEINAVDWFGLACFSRKASEAASMLILPDLYPVRVDFSAVFSAPHREESPGQTRRDGTETENGGVRDYAPGDPVRRIHWKLSTKTDRILIREEEYPLAGSVLLLLETAGNDAAPEDMDNAAEALLSVSRALAEENIPHSVSWQDRNELQWMEIACTEDFLAMRDALLSAEADAMGESIGAAFSRAYPHFRADQAVIFTPRPQTDGISLRENAAVTLALPRQAEGSPDLRVVCVCREEPELVL